MDSTRRSLLKALGLGAASLAACERLPVRHAIPYLVPPEEITPGVPAFYASTCTACSAGCGLMVKVLDGRPVKLEGDRRHPLSRGGLCPAGQASLRSLYDPSRLRHPTIDGREVSWAELDVTVRDGLARASSEGREIRVVSRSLVSPTGRRAVEGLLARHGGRLVEHDLDGRTPSAMLEAYELLLGEARSPALSLDDVELLVSLGADLFGAGPEPVAHTAQWAESRRRRSPRHVQIEGGLTLSGAAADERIPATAIERRDMALELLSLVASETDSPEATSILAILSGATAPGEGPPRLRALASQLLHARGRCLVVSGANDVVEQVAVALVNHVLGNVGTTLHLRADSRVARGLDRNLAALSDELLEGRLGVLVAVDVDLVSASPEGDAVARALAALPLSVAISDRPTATTSACRAVASSHHALECWGDVEVASGLRTLAQPALRPIFGTRHPFENFLRWVGDEETDYLQYLRDAWRERGDWTAHVRSAGLDAAKIDRDEIEPEPLRVDAALDVLRKREGGAPLDLELEVVPSHVFRAPGDFGNPWLRELPDPLTRVSWVPTVRIGPELARERGWKDGDVVELQTASGTLTRPVSVLPGQHPRVVSVSTSLGSAEALRLAGDADGRRRVAGLSVALEPTGAREALPLVQRHGSTEGRAIVHQVPSKDANVHAPHHPEASLWPEREVHSPHWEMVIDLDACTGCSACVVACQAENNIPVVGPDEVVRQREMHWLRIDRYFLGPEETPDVLFEPMLCAQCDDAPCETVCPVAATVHSEDGLNEQVYNRCVGTRYCANNCPYKVRRFNWFDNEPSDPVERLVLNPDVVVRSRGVMEKCTFCVQRIQGARLAARRERRESFEPEPACAQSCPAQAIRFGDGASTESEVTKLRALPRAFQVLAELGVRPSVSYLARVRQREAGEEASHGD